VKKVIAVDLDGTMAQYNGREHIDYNPSKVGQPIPRMIARIKAWLNAGMDVVIFTARVHPSNGKDEVAVCEKAIKKFCKDTIGQELEITCEKRPTFVEIWDDRAVRVIKDSGVISDGTDVFDPLSACDTDSIGQFLE